MRRVFVDRIEGLPPKKDGANSMWGKPSEFSRLVALRKAVASALCGQPTLGKSIRLILRVHVGPVNSPQIGDLDNFVTGICDGLQSANSKSALLADWDAAECESIHPTLVVAISDDSEVIRIDAEKIIDQEMPWYSLELIGE